MDTTAPAAVAAFDVSQYELEDTAVITLKRTNGTDLIGADGVNPVTIEIYSPGSPQGVKALHRSAFKQQMRLTRTLRGEATAKDAEESDRDQAEKLSSFTKALSNFPVAPLEFFSNPRLRHLHKQVDEGVSNFGNFEKGPSAS